MRSVRINSLGGFFTPKDLRQVALASYSVGAAGLYIGQRQELLLHGVDQNNAELKKLPKQIEIYDAENSLPNIMCSHSDGALNKYSDWAYETDAYQEVLQSLKTTPKLSLALLAERPLFVENFSSQVNFIASSRKHYWQIVLQFQNNSLLLPFLLLSEDIAECVQILEETVEKEPFTSSQTLARLLIKSFPEAAEASELKLFPPTEDSLEGFIPMPTGRQSLNLTMPDGLWPCELLSELCSFAHVQNIKRIYPTPQGTLLIKHLKKKDLGEWKSFLGAHGIVLRHHEEELAYNADLSRDLKLKRKLQKALAQEKFSYRRQSIALNLEKHSRGIYQIRSNKALFNTRYQLSHKKGFDPRSEEEVLVAKKLSFKELIQQLAKLNRQFYKDEEALEGVILPVHHFTQPVDEQEKVYQCPDCLSEYHPKYGSPEQGIDAGVVFNDLPNDWCCSLCETTKEKFKAL